MTDGRRTPVGDIAAQKNIDRHEKIGVPKKLGFGAMPAPNQQATSCVVDPIDAPATSLGESSRKLTPNQETMLNILAAAGAAGMTVEEWNEAARSEGIGARRRADLSDIRRTLKSKKLAHETMDRWYVTHI